MITQGKTGYWFRSLKVRPGGGKREGGKHELNHGIKDEQGKLIMISEAFVFVYIYVYIFHLKKRSLLTYLWLCRIVFN